MIHLKKKLLMIVLPRWSSWVGRGWRPKRSWCCEKQLAIDLISPSGPGVNWNRFSAACKWVRCRGTICSSEEELDKCSNKVALCSAASQQYTSKPKSGHTLGNCQISRHGDNYQVGHFNYMFRSFGLPSTGSGEPTLLSGLIWVINWEVVLWLFL